MSIRRPLVEAVVIGGADREMLARCLDRLTTTVDMADAAPELCISVIDNTGTRALGEWVAERYPSAQYFPNSTPMGFSANNNQRIRASRADYILLINDDAEMGMDGLAGMAASMEANPRLGLLGAQLMNVDGSPQPSGFGFPTARTAALAAFAPGVGYGLQGRIEQAAQGDVLCLVNWVPCACALARTTAIAEIGALDEGYDPGYVEDADWCRRFQKAGWQVAIRPGSQARHVGGNTFGASSPFRFVQGMRNLLRYHRKWDGQLAANMVRVCWTTGFALRILLLSVRREETRRKRISAYWAAIKAGCEAH